jgi:hypothetical protein
MKHVRAVALLLIIQGVAEIGMALFLLPAVGMSPFDGSTEEKADVFFYYMITVSIVLATCGILKIAAGVRNRRLRSRALGYVALVSALPTVLACWCAPTGLTIMVYGLVAYSRPEAREAFGRAGVALTESPPGLGRSQPDDTPNDADRPDRRRETLHRRAGARRRLAL